MLEKINHKSAPEEVINALLTLYHQGKYDDVLSRSSQLIKEYPHTFVLHNIMGAISFEKGHKEVAIEHFHKVIKLRPHHPHAYNNLGAVLIDIGEYQEAKSNLKKAIELQPDYAEAYNNLGNVYKEMEEYNEAIRVYEKAIELNPQYYEAYNNLGAALGKNEQFDEALKAYKKALSINPDSFDTFFNMAVTLQDQNKLENAIEAYKKVLVFKPDFAEAYNNMGIALNEQGKITEAIEAYNKTLSIKPNCGTAKHMLSALTGNIHKTAPREYVEKLFDEYSDTFEASLVEKLEYKIPKLIKDILIKPTNKENLGSVLDLGCGTGLFGTEVKNYCSKLEGIDLSKKMLAIANQKNVYDKLTQTDIVEYLSTMPLDFDYYIALDVFVYVGELTEIFRLIKSRNKKSGHLVFSTEHTENDGYHIRRTARYSHSKSYIENLCEKFDYSISHFSTNHLRKEKSVFLTGGIYVLSF